MGYLFATVRVEEGSEEPAVHDWRENLRNYWRRLRLNWKCLVVDSLILEEGVRLM